jgi:hypothetical protein
LKLFGADNLYSCLEKGLESLEKIRDGTSFALDGEMLSKKKKYEKCDQTQLITRIHSQRRWVT